MATNCEIRWCGKPSRKMVRVNENIGDGSFSVNICPACARHLGLREGQDLPAAGMVRRIIRKRNSRK